jgi:phosphoenolpyruvate carboxylase
MKINPVTRKILKDLGVATACGLVATGGILNATLRERKISEAKHEQVMEYVKQHNPDLYNDYLYTNRPIVDYYEAARDIREELKLDSIAKTNYALGMQAVRDSLVNAKK